MTTDRRIKTNSNRNNDRAFIVKISLVGVGIILILSVRYFNRNSDECSKLTVLVVDILILIHW